jgi:outer membrane protein OmpA-like peptidoglycan-associated protein
MQVKKMTSTMNWVRSTVTSAVLCVVLLSGCATKDFVLETVAPVQTQVGGLQQRVDGVQQGVERNGQELAALDGRVKASDERIGALSRTLEQDALARARTTQGVAGSVAFAMSTVLKDDRIKFANGRAELRAEGGAELDRITAQLKADNKPVFVEIQGHTDDSGSEAYNQRLGLSRAEAVRLHLARAGVPLARMATISYGESAPVAPNTNANGRSQNRRVVLVVMN